MTTREIPPCDHVWDLRHQDDFPPEVFWVYVCKVCGCVNGAELNKQLSTSRRKVDELAAENARLIESARAARQWAESVESERIANAVIL